LNFYAPHEELMTTLWERLDARLADLPAPLREQAEGLKQYIDAPARAYFSREDAPPLVLLPLWLGAGLPRAILEDIVEATALLYLFVRIQDDVLDEPQARGRADWLLLGNVLLWDGLSLLRKHVKSPEFWRESRSAWLDFNSATAAERRQLFDETRTSYEEPTFQDHCRKVAVAELPLFAILSLEKRLHLKESVRSLISKLGVAYGLTNDVIGFQRDVVAGMQTHLIAQIRPQVAKISWGNKAVMSAALLQSAEVESFLERARRAHRSANRDAKKLGLAQFPAFTRRRLARLDELERQTLLARLSAALAQETSLRSPTKAPTRVKAPRVKAPTTTERETPSWPQRKRRRPKKPQPKLS
jgi:phytoene/squalene synthetase